MPIPSILILKNFAVSIHCISLHSRLSRVVMKDDFLSFANVKRMSTPIPTGKNPESHTILNKLHETEQKRFKLEEKQANTLKHMDSKSDNFTVQNPKFSNENQQPELSIKAKRSDIDVNSEKGVEKTDFASRKLLGGAHNSNITALKHEKRRLSVTEEDFSRGINQIDPMTSRVHEKVRDSIQPRLPPPMIRFQSNKQNKPDTETDDFHEASITYNLGNSMHLLYIDLDDFAKPFLDVLFFYQIQLKFLKLMGIHNSIVKIPRIFVPKTLEDLITLYIYTESILQRDHLKQLLKNSNRLSKQMEKMEADKRKSRVQQQANANINEIDNITSRKKSNIPDNIYKTKSINKKISTFDMAELDYLKTVCNKVHSTLKNIRFPNNRIPDLINQKGLNNLYNCLFDMFNTENIFYSDFTNTNFVKRDIFFNLKGMKLLTAKINFSVSQKGFTKILTRFSHEFEKKLQKEKSVYFEEQVKCGMCKAIDESKKKQKGIDSNESTKNIFTKFTKKMSGVTKKPDTLLYRKEKIYTNEEITFLACLDGFEAKFNLPIHHNIMKSYLWKLFDFLYIKRRLYEIIYTWQNDFKELLLQSNTESKQNGDIFFLYNKHKQYLTTKNIKRKYSKEKYKFDDFKKNPVFDEYFRNYIKESQDKDIYNLLYKADTQDKEMKVLVDYLSRITIPKDIVVEDSDSLCSYCLLGINIRISSVTSEILEKTLEKYEFVFDQKTKSMDKKII